MAGFIYVWRDRKKNRYYVGSHWGTPDDGYVCSSQWMKRARGRRPEDFKRRIVAHITTSRKDLLAEEQRWLDMIRPHEMKTRYYNLKLQAGGFWHNDTDGEKSLSIREKLSRSSKERMKDPAARAHLSAKVSASLTGKKRKPFTDAHRAAISESRKKQVMSPEHMQKFSSSRIGKKNSPEHVEKIRQFWTGRKHTPETRAKMSVSAKNRRTRRPLSRSGRSEAGAPG